MQNRILSIGKFITNVGFIFLSGLLLASAPATAKESIDDERQWRLTKHKDGIDVYIAHNDLSRMKTFRGVSTFEVKNPYSFIGALQDYEYMPKWMHFVSGVNLIEEHSYSHRDVRITTNVPWPLKPREAIATATLEQDTQTYAVVMHFQNAPDLVPPNKEYLRIPEFDGRYQFDFIELADNDKYVVQVTYEIVIDPGGSIPTWLANLILTEIPYYTLKRYRRLLYSGKYDDYSAGDEITYPSVEEVRNSGG